MDKKTEIIVDASPRSYFCPERSWYRRPTQLAYPSKSFLETEQRYSQTEREAFAVVWGCEYFHLYVDGKPVTVCTDHKPLFSIYGKWLTYFIAIDRKEAVRQFNYLALGACVSCQEFTSCSFWVKKHRRSLNCPVLKYGEALTSSVVFLYVPLLSLYSSKSRKCLKT